MYICTLVKEDIQREFLELHLPENLPCSQVPLLQSATNARQGKPGIFSHMSIA